MTRRIPRAAWLALAGLCATAAPLLAAGVRLRAATAVYSDAKGLPLQAPESVGFGGGSRLAVADTGSGRIVTYTVSEEGIAPLGEFAAPEAPYPVRVRVTSQGEMLVLDGRSRRVVRLARDGASRGVVDVGRSAVVRAIAVDRTDRLLVLDASAPRILTFDAAGRPAGEAVLPAEAGFFSDLAVDARGDVFVLDSVGRQVYVLRSGAAPAARFGGSLAEKLDFATSLAVDGTGHVYLLDRAAGDIVILGPDGSFRARQSAMGWRDGFLRYPSDIAYDGRSALFVADRANNRVQVFAITQ